MSKNSQRRRLAEASVKQSGLCCYCGGATWLAGSETHGEARVRLGIPVGVRGAGKLLTAAMATREHLIRRADGGKNGNNVVMACHACNVRRHDSPPDVHRANMQAVVQAGLHPTNRPAAVLDFQRHLKAGLKALKMLRVGQPIEPQQETIR